MSDRQFGVYGKIIQPSSPLLTKKECLEISKCRDKTQLVTEIYEAVRRISSKYDDSLHCELYMLESAVVAYCRGLLHQDVSDAIAVALQLYRVNISSKHRGFNISRIIDNARISKYEEQTSQTEAEGDRESKKS